MFSKYHNLKCNLLNINLSVITCSLVALTKILKKNPYVYFFAGKLFEIYNNIKPESHLKITYIELF